MSTGYVTECRESLSNQTFIDLTQIISVFCSIYLLASPNRNDLQMKPKTKHCDVQCFFMLGANEQDVSAGTLIQ